MLLPGEAISSDLLPQSATSKAPLKIGPGLRHIWPSDIVTTHSGSLSIDRKKNAIWIENNEGRYLPNAPDLVIATVSRTATDYFYCVITPHTGQALLPHLAFEGVTKKSRPQIPPGALVYARVLKADQNGEIEIVCYNPSTGKAEGMGELKGGMLFDVSLGMARRLLMKPSEGDVVALELLAEKIAFEVAVGRNGKVWIKGETVKETLLVGKALQEIDRGLLKGDEQRKTVRKLLSGI